MLQGATYPPCAPYGSSSGQKNWAYTRTRIETRRAFKLYSHILYGEITASKARYRCCRAIPIHKMSASLIKQAIVYGEKILEDLDPASYGYYPSYILNVESTITSKIAAYVLGILNLTSTRKKLLPTYLWFWHGQSYFPLRCNSVSQLYDCYQDTSWSMPTGELCRSYLIVMAALKSLSWQCTKNSCIIINTTTLSNYHNLGIIIFNFEFTTPLFVVKIKTNV